MTLSSHISDNALRMTDAMARLFRERGASVYGEDFFGTWKSESGIRADIPNGGGYPYYGLNQMGVNEMHASGFPGGAEEWMALSVEQQIPYVQKFYENNIKAFAGGDWSVLNSPGSLYLINFIPAYLSHGNDPSWRIPDKYYAPNKSFDVDKKGYIEVGDLTKAIERAQTGAYWAEVLSRYQALAKTLAPAPVLRSVFTFFRRYGWIAPFGILAIGATGAWAAYRSNRF